MCKHCADQVIRRCVPEEEIGSIITHCHALSMWGALWEKWDSCKGTSIGILLAYLIQGCTPLCVHLCQIPKNGKHIKTR